MQELINKYLSRYYHIKKYDNIDEYCVFKLGETSYPYISFHLQRELDKIFGVYGETLVQLYVNMWAESIVNAPLNKYWEISIITEPRFIPAESINIVNAEEFAPRLSITARYAARPVNPDFYSTINVNTSID